MPRQHIHRFATFGDQLPSPQRTQKRREERGPCRKDGKAGKHTSHLHLVRSQLSSTSMSQNRHHYVLPSEDKAQEMQPSPVPPWPAIYSGSKGQQQRSRALHLSPAVSLRPHQKRAPPPNARPPSERLWASLAARSFEAQSPLASSRTSWHSHSERVRT